MKYYPGDILSKDWNPPVEIKGYRYFHLDTGKNNALEICWYDATFEDLYEEFGGYKKAPQTLIAYPRLIDTGDPEEFLMM